MGRGLQMMVFSATIPQALKPFLKKYLTAPTHVHIQPRQQTAVKIEHILYPTKHRSRVNIIANILKALNPYLAIIFVNTKQNATTVSNALMSQGFRVGQIHGDLTPRQRRQMMQHLLSNLEFQYIVATDPAARGIDIEGVSHVINYELPQDLEFYIHRVGRTARGNYDGVAITLYDSAEEELLQELEARGIEFNYKEVKNGELVAVNARNARQKREKKENEIDKIAKSKVRKPKKVTPGYKQNMKAQMEGVKNVKNAVSVNKY